MPEITPFLGGHFNLGAKLPRTQRGPNLHEDGQTILLAYFGKVGILRARQGGSLGEIQSDYLCLVTPSWAISSVSTATSLAVALKLGPVHLAGHPFVKFQRIFSLPDDIRTTDPFLRSIFPSATCLCQAQSEWSSVMPCFKMITVYIDCLGSLPSEYALSVPSR